MPRLTLAVIVAALAVSVVPAHGGARAAVADQTGVVDGSARFEVLTPRLIRLEYAADGRFENRPSMTATNRNMPPVWFRTGVEGHSLVLRTADLVLRYQRGSGPFTPRNLAIDVHAGPSVVTAHPSWKPAPLPVPALPAPLDETSLAFSQLGLTGQPIPDRSAQPKTSGNLGGWLRGLDDVDGPVVLHDGLISRDGWHLIDDSTTVLLTKQPSGFVTRPERFGAYQDGYFFGYGHDYIAGLADLRALTGPAPLLPRQAFGLWFSRYYPYRDRSYRTDLLPKLEAEQIPLSVLVIDTDYKAPDSWDGWTWDPNLFPDPPGFLAWAHSQGLEVTLNVHPSITFDDPRYSSTNKTAGGLAPSPACTLSRSPPAGCAIFDWTKTPQLDAYFALHRPFEDQGVDFWWLDWCCDASSAFAPGLTQDTWINSRYAQHNQVRGRRWLAFSRIGASFWNYTDDTVGAFAEHRYSIHFTGDTQPTWPMLNFEILFTPSEGNIGLPYVTHDIGSFAGKHLPDDLYVRWVQLGVFQPIMRLHSNHGDRLPWDYPGPAGDIAASFLRLRDALVPYLYTLAHQANLAGLPVTRPMYLGWPEYDQAYQFDHQYLLGDDLLVAPVGTPGDPATKQVWFPPGGWVDIFTGVRHQGPAVETLQVPLDRMPVFARAGAVIAGQPYRQPTVTSAPDPLILAAYPGSDGQSAVYEDGGDGFGNRQGQFVSIPILYRSGRSGIDTMTIGPVHGGYPGQPGLRSYEARFADVAPPALVTVNGRRLPEVTPASGPGWWYDPTNNTVVARTAELNPTRAVTIALGSDSSQPHIAARPRHNLAAGNETRSAPPDPRGRRMTRSSVRSTAGRYKPAITALAFATLLLACRDLHRRHRAKLDEDSQLVEVGPVLDDSTTAHP